MFTRVDTPTVMDGLVVRWQLAEPYTGEISASRNGVLISGTWPVLKDAEALAVIKLILDEARRTHVQIRHGNDRGLYGASLYDGSRGCDHTVDGRRCVFAEGHGGEHRLGDVP